MSLPPQKKLHCISEIQQKINKTQCWWQIYSKVTSSFFTKTETNLQDQEEWEIHLFSKTCLETMQQLCRLSEKKKKKVHVLHCWLTNWAFLSVCLSLNTPFLSCLLISASSNSFVLFTSFSSQQWRKQRHCGVAWQEHPNIQVYPPTFGCPQKLKKK
jgi:hypothetical protein